MTHKPPADKPNWGEPVFPIHAPYPGGYSPANSPRFPGITPDAPPLTHKIRITTAPDPTPPPEPVVQKTQTDNAEPAPRLPRTPSQTKPKDPRMALGKLLFGGGNRRTAVPGGWLISQSLTGGLVFLPDPDHEWDGDSLTLYPDNND